MSTNSPAHETKRPPSAATDEGQRTEMEIQMQDQTTAPPSVDIVAGITAITEAGIGYDGDKPIVVVDTTDFPLDGHPGPVLRIKVFSLDAATYGEVGREYHDRIVLAHYTDESALLAFIANPGDAWSDVVAEIVTALTEQRAA